jgi:GTPase
VLYVFSKTDAIAGAELLALRERIGNLFPNSAVLAAAKKGTEIAEIRLPAENGKLLAEIYRTGNVLSQRTDDGQIVLRARVDEQLAGRLARWGASVAYPRKKPIN